MIRVKNRMLMFSLFLGFVLTSTMVTPPTGVFAGSVILLPETNAVDIDGIINEIEWTNSARFETTLNQRDATVFVTTNNSDIYFAINFTQADYTALNMTAPVNVTDFNPGLNRTHDFLALQIDRNFDKLDLGSEESVDDIVIVNRYDTVGKDGFASGNKTSVLTLDTDANGTEDSNTAFEFNNVTNQVSYEFAKNMKSNDSNGGDFNVLESRGVQFRFIAWFNQTANATFSTAFTTSWFTLRMNETGGLASVQPVTSTSVTLDYFGLSAEDKSSVTTAMEFSGYNVSVIGGQNNTDYANSIDGTLVFVIGDSALDKGKAEAAINYVRSGGTAIFILSGESDEATKFSQEIADAFNLDFSKEAFLTANDTFEMTSDDLGNMDYLTGSSVATDEDISTMKGNAYLLNTSRINESPLILSQKYMQYEIINLPGQTFVDSNGDGKIEGTEPQAKIGSVAVGFDFLKGGRAVISSFNPILSDNNLVQGNIPFLYRTIAWVSKQTQALVAHASMISDDQITQNDKLKVTANVTDLFNQSLKDNLDLKVEILRAGSVIQRTNMVEVDGTYTSDITIKKFGWMEVVVEGNASQYGFVEFKSASLLVERDYAGFNTDKNFIIIALGLGTSIAIAFLAYKKLKTYR